MGQIAANARSEQRVSRSEELRCKLGVGTHFTARRYAYLRMNTGAA